MNPTNYEDERRLHGCKKNKLATCLAITITTLIFALFFGFFGYFGFPEISTYCNTPECLNASAELSEIIDDSIDPCTDFYSFVCGKLIKNQKTQQNSLKQEYEKIEQTLDALIVGPETPDDSQEIRMQKQYFQACLNTTNIDSNKEITLIRELNSVGGWPFLQNSRWIEKEFDWIKFMIRARKLRLPFEWFLNVGLFFDRGQYQLKVSRFRKFSYNYKPQLSHPDDCGLNINEDYFTMQRKILEQLRKPGIDAIVEFTQLENFERKLNSICANMTDNDISVRRASNLWLDGIGPISNFLTSVTGLRGWKSNSWVAYNHNYLFELNHLLKLFSKKTQALFILWKIIHFYAPYLSKPIREKYFNYLEIMMQRNISREEFCLEDTKEKFKYVSEIKYLTETVDPETREEGKGFVASLVNEITDRIENDTIRRLHSETYSDLEEVIVGPEEIFDDTFIEEYLQIGQLHFFTDNIILMLNTWSQRIFEKKMSMIGKPFLSLDSIFANDGEYSMTLDELLSVPSVTFYTFFNTDVQKYLEYGSLGTIVGTEIVRLEHYLNGGNQKLETNKNCMIENIKSFNRRFNASIVYEKNFLAWLGQELSYQAYQKYTDEEGAEAPLPDLPYTPNQLFWIKSSLTWCQAALLSPENSFRTFQMLRIKVTESVKHSEFFGKDFNCPTDSPMNPENKCQLL